MKKFVVFAIVLAGCFQLQAQSGDSVSPPFKRFPTIPPIKLLKIDSTTFLTRDDIKKNRRTIIMYFSPECDHCKHQTQDILAAIDKFKDIEIVMATYQPFDQMKEFYNYYRIADHPNIKLGRDEKFVLPPFYRIQNLPYLALYDKKGKLVTTFDGNQKVSTILGAFDEKGND